jgi:hypothetical protein
MRPLLNGATLGGREPTRMSTDWDDSANRIRWRVEMRALLEGYLAREGVQHSPVPLIPKFTLVPYVSLWHCKPDVWIIAGDLPTDYFVLPEGTQPRAALRAFADRWTRGARHMIDGTPNPEGTVGDPTDRDRQLELADLIDRRASLLRRMADDDAKWADNPLG